MFTTRWRYSPVEVQSGGGSVGAHVVPPPAPARQLPITNFIIFIQLTLPSRTFERNRDRTHVEVQLGGGTVW